MSDKLWFGLERLAQQTQDAHDARMVAVNIVSATGNGADLLQQLQDLGLQDAFCYGANCTGSLAAEDLLKLNDVDDVLYAMRPLAQTRAGSVQSEALGSMNVNQTWAMFNTQGAGVKIGVISDSFDKFGSIGREDDYARDVSTGDLPLSVQVLQDDFSEESDDEGRGMMQHVYDIAPEAELYFHTSGNTEAEFAQAIQNLADAGCKVIVDDIYILTEPFYMDGLISQAVENVTNAGALFFSAVGNSGRDLAYEAAFDNSGTAGPDGGMLHDFDPGAGVDTSQTITLAAGATGAIIFQWDQPFSSSTGGKASSSNDLNIYLYDDDGELVAESAEANIGSDPIEILQFSSEAEDVDTSYELVISLAEGSAPGQMKWLPLNEVITIDEYASPSPTSVGHVGAPGAVGVGAADWKNTPFYGDNPPVLEDFSSDGPVTILFDDQGNRLDSPEYRATPLLVAPDNCSNTFFGTANEDGTFSFSGTSAAAPQAAAVASLLWSAVPTATSEQVLTAMTETAVNMGPDGYDYDSGYGLIQADDALAYLTQGAAFDPVYEFSFGDVQFWTSSKDEKLFVQASGAPYKGIGFGAATGETAVDVYRFYSPITSDHFLTTSAQERDWVQANLADWYNYEGVGLQVYASELSGTTELYRFFDTQDGVHYYTASKEEYAENLQTPGYVYQGVMGWVEPFVV